MLILCRHICISRWPRNIFQDTFIDCEYFKRFSIEGLQCKWFMNRRVRSVAYHRYDFHLRSYDRPGVHFGYFLTQAHHPTNTCPTTFWCAPNNCGALCSKTKHVVNYANLFQIPISTNLSYQVSVRKNMSERLFGTRWLLNLQRLTFRGTYMLLLSERY